MTDSLDIQHDRDAHRFSVIVDGTFCELDYQLDGKTMAIVHTGVPPEVGGRGIAGQLTVAALNFARAEGLKVRPLCSYAAVFFRRHSEYAELLA
ncbi:MAG: GNAT family N-acetyltransferase [Steroidobacteraceae bacterium]